MYLPSEEDGPAYDGYVDPAVAHGWQNAYDETAELPRVGAVAGSPADRAGGRADRRRAARRPRRVVVGAGAVGVVSVAALIAGLALSGGSNEDGERGTRDGTRSTSGEPAASPGSVSPSVSDSAGPGDPAHGASAGPSAAPSASATASEAPAASPSASAVTSSAPADVSSPSASPTGKANGKGRGPGASKGPR
ncbi:hypothetical protein ACFW2D_00520 [Streptomyces sp. NPDC058914]|uniref:hypothetical protein n=1 Tax=Streptomyces sp. NPDC058914 TaxID=3346671 RepID=UPI0036BC75DD